MTLAICTNCGNEKLGALTPCPECGFDPGEDKVAQAKALLLCDHNASAKDLRAASAAIKAGQEVTFDVAELDAFVQELEQVQVPRSAPLGCQVFWWTLIAIMIGLFAVVVCVFVFLER